MENNDSFAQREVKMVDWKCKECGYTLKADTPPEECPSCHEKCEFVDVSCYIPECGETGQDPRLG
jgi:rubrerythrin